MMNKYYSFKFNKNMEEKRWQQALQNSLVQVFDLHWLDGQSCYFYSSENLNQNLSDLLALLENDIGTQISALVSHDIDKLSIQALELAFKYRRGKLLNLADVCMLALINNEHAFLVDLSDYFSRVDEELLRTMVAFISNSGSGHKTATKLYIHRNTWLYRRQKFTRLTNLDLRDIDDLAFFNWWRSWQECK